MSEISERYQRLGDAFAAEIAAVGDDQWSSPTPCAEWTARDLVGHVVGSQGMFLGFVGQEVGDVPTVDDDPLGALERHPRRSAGEPRRPARGDGRVRRLLRASDLRVRGRPVPVRRSRRARVGPRGAAGLDEQMDPDDVAACARPPRRSARRRAARRCSAPRSKRRRVPTTRSACWRSSAASPDDALRPFRPLQASARAAPAAPRHGPGHQRSAPRCPAARRGRSAPWR